MKGSRKTGMPEVMKAWLEDANVDWRPEYPFNESRVRNAVRKSLLKEQRGLCLYCGVQLDTSMPGDTFHIEHFIPQSISKADAINYNNLFLSCGTKNKQGKPSPTCGNARKNWYHETDHVKPEYPDCVSRFRFLLTGKVVPAVPNDTAAQNMIDNMKLNHAELVIARRDVFDLIDSGAMTVEDYYDDESGIAESYAHIVYLHFDEVLP
ncbi:retron system putative HNH endonuclease [Agrobacterium sp. fls2-241-TYG-188a]|uniref:retron system putative HNH endonuclease n=1 Tax=Agrobacterium sp. fls2-241-TYG-188a TaxID=3040275 RepID=UPI00254EFACD|nr:retron system putative HNH endonuclease [Agrobacterium sp. fls2-241-TYG-188a]